MTVTVKREDYEALQRAYAKATKAIRWAIVAVVVALAGLVVSGYGLYDYFQKRDAELAADARTVCDNAVANRQTAREQDFATVGYVDDVVSIIDEFVGIPPDLLSALIARSNARLEEINQQRPPLAPGTCPPEALPPPPISTVAAPPLSSTPTSEED